MRCIEQIPWSVIGPTAQGRKTRGAGTRNELVDNGLVGLVYLHDKESELWVDPSTVVFKQLLRSRWDTE